MAHHGHRRAVQLGAGDARQLLATVPGLIHMLSQAQIAEIQKVMDAAVLNPVLQKEAEDAYRGSVIARDGPYVLRDPVKERRAEKKFEKIVPTRDWETRIRLDYRKMLTADALTPRTDNPDEADYLHKVKMILEDKGVWLQMRMAGAKTWFLVFTLGPKGDEIPTKDRMIDRDELLKTTMLGAGYYRAVWTGSVQHSIDQKVEQLWAGLKEGLAEHHELLKNRRASPGVARVSEVLGGAGLPDTSVWDEPQRLLVTGMRANSGGDVIQAQAYLLTAAVAIRYNAERLAEYLKRTDTGAGRAVKILKVVKTIGKVAEALLVLTGVGGAVIRGAEAAAAPTALDKATLKLVSDYAKRNGISEAELSAVRYVRGPAGNTLGSGIKYNQSAGLGKGWQEGW